jgi:probable phosphoglycerate mutase
MLKIYIARHGQDQDNANGVLNGRRDKPLTKVGEDQAKALAEKINQIGLKFDIIYSSPLNRTLKTAGIISKICGATKPVILENLIERDFGIMTGQPISTIKEKCSPDILQAEIVTYFLKPEGAETFPDLIIRANKILSFLKSKHKDESILLVTSGDVGKMIYAAYYSLPWENILTQFHFGNSELLILSETSPAQEVHVFKQTQLNP